MTDVDAIRGRARTLLLGWRVPAAACGLIVVAMAGALLPHLLHLPQVTNGERIATPVGVIAAWLAGLLALLTAQEPAPALFATAPRITHVVNVTRSLLVLLCGLLLAGATSDGSLLVPLSAGAAFAGEGLFLAGLAGLQSGWVLPTLHLLACTTLGNANRAHGLAAWAWPLDQHPGAGHLCASGVLLMVGVVVWARSLRSPSRDS